MPKPEAPPGSCRVFIGNLPKGTFSTGEIEEELKGHLSTYGEICDVFVKRAEQFHLGYGFVTFTSRSEIESSGLFSASIEMRGLNLTVKEEDTQRSKGGKGGKGSTPQVVAKKLFCGGLPRDCNEDQLRAHFEQFGNIKDCFVTKQPDGTPKGFGFVEFSTEEEAQAATATTHTLDGKEITVNIASPKPEKGSAGGGKGGWDAGGKGGWGAGGGGSWGAADWGGWGGGGWVEATGGWGAAAGGWGVSNGKGAGGWDAPVKGGFAVKGAPRMVIVQAAPGAWGGAGQKGYKPW